MADDAHERERLRSEEKRRAEEQAREVAEAADAANRTAKAKEEERAAKTEASPTQYCGFSWGSSFDDPRVMNTAGAAPDAPRIVELDVE